MLHNNCQCYGELAEQHREHFLVFILAQTMPKLGEQSMAWRLPFKAACSSDPPILLQQQCGPSVAWNAEQMLQQLGLQDRNRIVRLPSKSNLVMKRRQELMDRI